MAPVESYAGRMPSPIIGPQSSPRGAICKGTVTRYRCGFQGCNKRYASTDGVRKHARKMHLGWLKSIDENAGARDRHLESKPSTYCVMEVTDADDAGELASLEPSPLILPSMTTGADIPAMNLGACDLTPLPLPEGACYSSTHDSMVAGAITAATANQVGAGSRPPLAWLLAQHPGVNSAPAFAMPPSSHHPPTAHAVPQHGNSLRTDLPVAVAAPHLPQRAMAMAQSSSAGASSAPPRMPSWSHEAAIGNALLCTSPCSPIGPLPPVGSWTAADLMNFFPSSITEAARVDGGHDAPLSGSPPLHSQMAGMCVSPFVLEKRPKPFGASSAPSSAPPTEALLGSALLGDHNFGMNGMMPKNYSYDKISVDISGSTDDLTLFENELPFLKEAEYAEFIETLLSIDNI